MVEGIKSRSFGDGAICVEALKTIKARIIDPSASSEIQTLLTEWNRLVWKCYWRLSILRKDASYYEFAKGTPLAKYYVCAAIRLAEGKLKAFHKLRKSEHRVSPQRVFDEPLQLTNVYTYRLHEDENGCIHISISYMPNKSIKTKLIFGRNDANEEWLRKALHNDKGIRVKGAQLVERDGEYWLYITIEKEVDILHPLDCETLVGVDFGENRLAVATAITKERKIHRPLFIHGGLARHLLLRKRKEVAKLRRRRFNEQDARRYYSRRINEELHTASKRVIEYAK